MIGAGLKKLAKQYNLRVDAGVAYGSLRGYATTLFEGAGYKQINISTTFPEVGQKEQLMEYMQSRNIEKEFRVRGGGFCPAGVSIIFFDTVGTMKKISAFIEWFYPLLEQIGVTGADVCCECGGSVSEGQWHLVSNFAHHMHESCAQKMEERIAEESRERKESRTGSYVQGAIGALLGALLGAALWAIVLYLGYIASLVGLVIGWLANKGYDLLHGKQGKGKVVILILAIIIGVLVGTFAPDVVVLCQMIGNGELIGLTYGDIPWFIAEIFAADSTYATGVISNVVIGLLFAMLGVFALLKRTNREVSDTKVKKLK